MRKKSAAIAAAIVALVLAWSCASTQLAFLDKAVPDPVKSKIVTDAGIAAYNETLVQKGELSQVESIKAYFINALRFDPGNATAQRYLTLTSNFKAAYLQDILKKARALAKKDGRSEDETYRLCVLVQEASTIDAKDPELLKLDKEIAVARDALVNAYLAKANLALDKRAKATTDASKESLAVTAFQSLAKASAADPSNAKARSLLSQVKPDVTAIIQKSLKAIPALLDSASYTKARTQIDLAANLSTKLGGSYDASVNKAYYDLYFAWASYFYNKKDYAQAEPKIAAALSAQKDPAALALRQKIAVLKEQSEQGANFEEGLANVDGLIKRGSLAPAMRILSALAVKTTEKAKLDQIEERRTRIKNALADAYARGVAAYQAEKFDVAIDALDDIVGIDPGYQQAADYLEKARAKQQILLGN